MKSNKKMIMKRLIFILFTVLLSYSCTGNKDLVKVEKNEPSEIEHIKTELGGCNANNALTRSSSGIKWLSYRGLSSYQNSRLTEKDGRKGMSISALYLPSLR